ncbi:MAG: leucine-rich repeat domain-containing protein [Oscillospiraceae bacterium]|nr:leucine-rich repeat domain-containing protein [Oscillospiraceae bacterium]
MKKTGKIVLPILLVLCLLAVGYWFFFQYRVDITTGLLRSFADSQYEAGHYTMAVRCYRWASDLDPQDAELALKLAEAYRSSGNYSKTEKVLVNAIYDAPGEEQLYVALSQVFVEQDKLLDAQQLLDNIANEEVRQALEARRPAAPVLEPAGGFYSDYISVSIREDSPDAVCYCTVDSSYPSKEKNAYTGPIELTGGETAICAVAVNDEGLVSTAVYGGYTVSGIVEDAEIDDPALLACFRELLRRGERTLRTDELWGIEELTLPEGVADTAGLRYCTGMTKLVGLDQGELDYSFLEAMPELRYLELENCILTREALERIGACPNLEVLILANCGLNDVSALGNLESLRVLDLSDNAISNIDALMRLSALDELYLGHNALTTIPFLRGLKTLRVLDLSYNALSYVNGVSSCTTLERLNLSHNKISSLTPLSALTELVWLNASANAVSDAAVLSPCTKLESFLMDNNRLQTIDFLSACPNILEVNVDYNDITAVPDFQKDCPLESFSAAHNFLEDLSGLSGLPKLAYVNADYNNIRNINVLKDCPALTQVNVYGTYITSGGELAENGVIVNFTPSF